MFSPNACPWLAEAGRPLRWQILTAQERLRQGLWQSNGLIYLRTEELCGPALTALVGVLSFFKNASVIIVRHVLLRTPRWEVTSVGSVLRSEAALPPLFTASLWFEIPGLPAAFLSDKRFLQTAIRLDLHTALSFTHGFGFLLEEVLE